MPFPASLNLSSLNGTNGFRVDGVASFGVSVASAGDVNGDGYDDFIVGTGGSGGAAYVVFGKASGFPANFSVSTLTGANGFKIAGPTSYNNLGGSVSSAGDINNDGFDDLIVGADAAQPNGVNTSGAAYVLLGKATGFAAVENVSALNGSNGFQLTVPGLNNSFIGHSVANAGDVNDDGFDDLIVGAHAFTGSAGESGAAFVVFGKAGGFAATSNLASLNGSNGFRLTGAALADNAGWAVNTAGDVNGDGVDDLIVGAELADPHGKNSGAAYVIFGKASPFAADINLSTLDGTNGFRISGLQQYDNLGWSVSTAGDVNGDGYADVMIGAPGLDAPTDPQVGGVYVVFGKASGFAPDFNLASLDGKNGFLIQGTTMESAGTSVASAGDVNNDGYDDLIVGEPAGSTRAAYVIFGKASGFAARIDPAGLNGVDGFKMVSPTIGDRGGLAVASAGDINGDGYDDLIVGVPDAAGSGDAYIVFGQATPVAFAGTAGADDRQGAGLDDTLSGLGGNDILRGMAGDDTLDGGDLSDQLFGGDGADDLVGGGGGDLLYGEAGADELKGGDGADKLFGGTGADTLAGEAGNDRMEGGDDADSLTGGAGNDYLDGGAGVDVMTGGVENDVYIVDNANDQTVELANEGYDIVRTALDGWVLAANLEGLELLGSADIDGSGNAGANNLQGNSGANTLYGLAGVDTINGADGDDIIIGGEGNDLLRGGTGADTFLVAHSFGSVLETDQIYDFSAAEGDIMDFQGAYAGTLAVVSSFGKHAGEMTLTFASGITTVKLDINGDGKADYQVKINGDVTGEAGGWLL